jgi:hypothetical protein
LRVPDRLDGAPEPLVHETVFSLQRGISAEKTGASSSTILEINSGLFAASQSATSPPEELPETTARAPAIRSRKAATSPPTVSQD